MTRSSNPLQSNSQLEASNDRMWPLPVAQRAIIVAGCLAMAYTQLTMSPATIQFARSLGATGLHIGILGALPAATLFMQFVAAVVVNHLRFRRKTWFAVSILQRLVFLPLCLGPFLIADVSDAIWLWVLILLTAANHAMMHFSTPLWMSWMGDYLPHKGLSHYWGVRQLWMQWTAAASLAAAALFLLKGGFDIRFAFAMLIGVGTVLGIADILIFLRIDEPPVDAVPEPKLKTVLAAPFQNRDFRAFIRFTCFWHFAAMVGAPFISLFLLAHVGMELFDLLMIWVFSWIGGAILSSHLGRLAERFGHRPLLILCTAFKSLNMLALLAIPPNPTIAFFVLIPVFMLDALLNTGIAIANNGFLLKNSPSENRAMFIAAGTAVAGMVGGATSILAGVLHTTIGTWTVDIGGKVFTNFHVLFAISIVLRLVAAVLARRVREPDSSSTFDVVVQLVGVTPFRILRYPTGLYGSWKTRGTQPAVATQLESAAVD